MALDPLSALRKCVKGNLEIKELKRSISLDGQEWPKEVETNYLVKLPKDAQNERKYYTLEEVVFFHKNAALTHPNYVSKAQEKNIRPVRRPDRKELLAFISCNPDAKPNLDKSKAVNTKIVGRQSAKKARLEASSNNNESPSKKARIEESSNDSELSSKEADEEMALNSSERVKQGPRTYSKAHRNLRASPQRLSTHAECVDAVIDLPMSALDLTDELADVQLEVEKLSRSVNSVTTFLRDFLGLTPAQLQVLMDGTVNEEEFNNIASSIKSGQGKLQNISSQSKYCYQAVKHPLRGWETLKKDLPLVLFSCDDNPTISTEIQDNLEKCLSIGAPRLRHLFSGLIYQMQEYSKSQTSAEEIDKFCQKIVKENLTSAMENFREMFDLVLTPSDDVSRSDELEKWLSVSEAELQKLLHSLVSTLQSLRDIPVEPGQRLPSTLFHFPEPVFSLAMNPSKVTHNVLLEMYLRIGLADLRHILLSIMGSNNEQSDFHGNDFVPPLIPENYRKASQVQDAIKHFSEQMYKQYQERKEKEQLRQHVLATTPILSADLRMMMLKKLSCSASGPTAAVAVAVPAACGAGENNGRKRSNVSRSRSTNHRPRSIESNAFVYNKFKTSLGNTLLSSFKKQIQDKIHASDIHPALS